MRGFWLAAVAGGCAWVPPAGETEAPEVVVTATRTERAEVATPAFVSTVPSTELVRRGARTTPQALAEEPGVLVQETNLGGGSPFLRGLTGNQILVLVDGVRLNNSAFARFGPNQYLNTVDPFSLESIEVVRGPGSVQYG
ncbi:MAG: TonB-dependent receptor plug domain-containing protein, partial [Planctomycetota bacterium]